MSHSQYERVSVFREDTMREVDDPKLSPRSSYSTGLEKPSVKVPTFNYKPLILRTIPLLLLLALTLGLIGVLEYAILRLPHGSKAIIKRDETTLPAHELNVLRRRNDTSETTSTSSFDVVSSSSSLSFSSPSTLAYTTATSAYVDSGPTSFTTATSAFVDTDATILPSTDATAFVKPKSTETTSKPVTVFAASPSAYVGETSTFTATLRPPAETAETAYVSSTVVVTPPSDSLVPTAASTETSAFVAPSSTQYPTPGSGDDHHDNENGTGAGQGHNGSNSDDSTSNGDHASVDNQRASLVDGGDEVVMKWEGHQVFLGTYLAICVAVLYRLLWIVLYNAFNLIEPFRQLMDGKGAIADKAFFSFYQSQSALLGPFPALKRKRWTLALVGTAYFIANILPALASECVYVDTDYDCAGRDDNNTNNPCFPRMTANATVLRAMQGLLGFAAVVLLFTASLLLFNKTGLPTKPNSIAAIASLMRHPRLLADFSDMPVNASAEHMQRLMAGKRYRMGHYTCANGLTGYGIQPLNGYDSHGFASPLGGFKHEYTPVDGSMPFPDRKGESVTLRRFQFQDFVLAFFVLGAFGVVLAYFLDGNKDPFNDFFNSNTFGPRFILTLAGTVIASNWRSVEQDAMVMAPYIRLSHRPSSAASTILLTPTSTPLTSTIRSLRHRYFFAASITILTLLAEALNVVISGVPYASGQTLTQYLVSSYMSLAILGLMILVSIGMIVRRFWEPEIPRKPNTVGAVMSYLCSSRMLDDFEGTEGLDERTIRTRFSGLVKKYEFSETVRRDGKLAWAVDEAFDVARC